MSSPPIRQTTHLSLSLLLLCFWMPGQLWAQQPSATSSQEILRLDTKRAQKALERGDRAQAEGRIEDALSAYDEAARYAPQDPIVVGRALNLRSMLVRDHVDKAEQLALSGKLAAGREELIAAKRIDPSNTAIAERIAQMEQMRDDAPAFKATEIQGMPRVKPQNAKRSFDLRGDTRAAYEQVAQAFGIKTSFDPDLVPRNVRLHLENVDFNTAMSILATETATFWIPIHSTLMFVAPDTTEKRRQYGLQAEQTFPLTSSVAPEEMTELLRLLREITGATHLELDVRSRTITMRDSPQKLALAAELIGQVERARGELMLDIELLEVDRNKAQQLGITPPSSTQAIPITPNDVRTLAQATDLQNALTILGQLLSAKGLSSSQGFTLVGGGYTRFLLTLPGVAANFSDALNLVQSGRQVLLRAQDGKPATFFVGDRYPVTLSLLSGSLGSGVGGQKQLPLTGVPSVTSFPETSFNVGNNPVALVADNFSGGNLPDLAVATQNDNSISILINQDNGNLSNAKNSPFVLAKTETGPSALATGIFGNTATNSAGNTITPIDLVVANAESNNVAVLFGNGDGTFQEAPGSPYNVGGEPSSVVVADFNGDGNLDFAVSNQGDNSISLFRGDGKGGFAEFPGSPFSLGRTLEIDNTALPEGLLNRPYSAFLKATGGGTGLTWNIASGTLPPGLSLNASTGAITGTPATTGTTTFTVTATNSAAAESATTTLSIAVAAAPSPLSIATSLTNGNAGGPYSQLLTATGGQGPYTWSIASGSLPTGLTLTAATGAITGTPQAGTFPFTVQVTDSSNPPFSAQQQFTLSPSSATQRGPVAMVKGNFRSSNLSSTNTAPEVDLAVVNQASNNVSILLGGLDVNGNPTLTEATNSPIAVGNSPVAIATGDLNADGVPDLAVVNQGDNTVSILLGSSNLDGTFTPAAGSPLPTATTPAGITIANFAGGAVPDLAVTNKSTATLGVYLGLGGGIFSNRIEIATPASPGAIVSGIFTSSGLPDVALTAQGTTPNQGVVAIIQDSSSLASSGGTGAAQTPYPASEYVDLGVKVKATPTLHNNHEVTLRLEFEIRALAGANVNGIPVISNRTLNQTVRVKEDETTLIGGLLDNEETRSLVGLPGFANLPGVGYVFGNRSSSHKDTEFLILITPRKLRDPVRNARTIFAGRGDTGGRGSVGANAPLAPRPPTPPPMPEPIEPEPTPPPPPPQ